METLIGILIVAALVGGVIAFTWLKDKAIGSAVGAVNRKVQSRTHAEGLEYVHNQFFYAIDRPSEEIIDALRQGVKAGERAPVAIPATHLVSRETERITWACANKVQTLWTASAMVVTAHSEEGEQRGVVLTFPEAIQADGVVAEVSAMRVLKNEVLTALQSLDPDTEETVLEFD